MKTQILQYVKELLVRLETVKYFNDFKPLSIYVESRVYYRFLICCYTQNIEPYKAITNYMKAVSSPQTVESIKETIARAKI
jgi:hypothetical protein